MRRDQKLKANMRRLLRLVQSTDELLEEAVKMERMIKKKTRIKTRDRK